MVYPHPITRAQAFLEKEAQENAKKHQNPILNRPETPIKEPESRATSKAARYAGEKQDKAAEQEVAAPSKLYLEKEDLPPPSEGKWGGRAKGRDKLPRFGHLQDSVNIYNQKNQDWQFGWEHRFNKRTVHHFFSNKVQATDATVVSKPFYCAPYRNALIFYNISKAAAGTQTIHFEAEFSWDGVAFFPIWLNWWGYDQIVAAMMPHRDCMPVPVLARWIRFKYTTANVEQGYELTLSVFGVFNSV